MKEEKKVVEVMIADGEALIICVIDVRKNVNIIKKQLSTISYRGEKFLIWYEID